MRRVGEVNYSCMISIWVFPEVNEMRSEFNAEKQKISEGRWEMNGML